MAKVKLSKLQKAYREFFSAMMDEYDVKSPVQLGDKRSEFFNRIKKEWPKAKKAIKEGILRQEIRVVIAEVLEKKSLIEGRVKRTTFGKLSIGDELYFEEPDFKRPAPEQATRWVKNSNKTVKNLDNGRKFHASNNDEVFVKE